MNEELFESTYAQMSDGELARILRDKRDLTAEAEAALDREILKRNLDPSQLRKVKSHSIDKPWKRTRLGRVSRKIGIDSLRTKRIRGVWLVLLILLSFLLAAALDHFGILESFWPIVTTAGISVFTIWGHWELKLRPWFWATLSVVVAAHVVFFHFFGWPWGQKWVPAMTIAGLWSIDLFAVFALIYVIEKLMQQDNDLAPRPRARS